MELAWISTPQTVYVPRKYKVPMFTGFPEKLGQTIVEEWVDAVKSAFRTCYVPLRDQAHIVLDYPGGQARQTVKVMPEHDQWDILKVFETLERVYGITLTVGGLLKDFYDRTQQFNEKSRAYGYDLQERMQRVVQQDEQ